MTNKPNAFTQLRVLHLALLIGMLAFAAISILVVETTGKNLKDDVLDRALQIVAVILSLGTFIIGLSTFKKKLLAIRNSSAAAMERFGQYRAACIMWWALLEAPGLFAIMCFILSGNYAFIALGVMHMIVLLIFRPGRENIIQLLNLNSVELQELETNQ